MSLSEHDILESSNIFEKYISENKVSKIYAFSPKIYEKFNKILEQINTYPTNSLIYVGNDSFYSTVYFYKSTCGNTYIFLIYKDSIADYFLLQ